MRTNLFDAGLGLLRLRTLALVLLGLPLAAPLLAQTLPLGRPAPGGSTTVLLRLPAGAAALPAADGPRVLRQQLGLGPDHQFRPLRTEADALGFTHERFQQYFRGLKVEHGVCTVHARSGRVELLSGEVKRPAPALSTRPALAEGAALRRALATVGARRYQWQEPAEEALLRRQTRDARATFYPQGELVLVEDFRALAAARPLVLAWKFNVYARQPVGRELIYVDARTGQVVLRDAIIKHVNAPGTLATRYVGTRSSTTDAFAGGFRLRETTRGRGVTTLNCRRGTSFAAAVDFVDNDNNWTAAEHNNANFDNAALDAHVGAQATQDYFATQHGRDSFDNRGAVLLSYVHYGSGIENAFWDGTEMVYGDGGTRFRPLTSVDVCAHEIGHAVCQSTAGLIYQNESGALNEGFSDIWGASVEYSFDPAKQTWLIGEDVARQRPSLRSMSNPNAENQPDTYLGTNWYTGTVDNGGVHTNSGVLNYWYYLLSVGGAGTNDFGTAFNVTGITIQKAARIAYRAENLYLTPSSNYPSARAATLQAAVDLYGFGSAEAMAVAQAWQAVGLGQPAPTLGSFAPASGTVGQLVQLTGTNLGSAFEVAFNGVPVRAGVLGTDTQLSVTVPRGATSGLVTVTTPSGTATSAAVFTVTGTGPAPAIGSYVPAAGQRAGAPVVVAGVNFTGATDVSIGGVNAVFTVNSATQLTATVPATASSGALAIVTPGGTASVPFAVLPYVAGVSPGSGIVGAMVSLTGTGFTGALSVKFNGVYAPYVIDSATSITATVPAGAVTGAVMVRTPAGTATGPGNFTVTPSLAVTGFSPGSGPVGTGVTIRGLGFTGATAVRFNGVAATAFIVADDTELQATVPATATSGRIEVTSPLGTAQSAATFVVFVPGAPVITSFTPAAGVVGSSVTLTGADFSGVTAVRFNGTAATFTVNSNLELVTTVPAGATTGLLTVTTPLGTGQSATDFMVVPVPSNDLCTATNLPVVACGDVVMGTTYGATRTGDPTGTCGTGIDAAGGVFYRFVGNGARVTMQTCGVTNYDTKLFVFTGSCGSYTCVTGDDDGCGTTASAATFQSVNGTPYLVYVAGNDVQVGNFMLTANCTGISSFTPTSGPVGTPVMLTVSNISNLTGVQFNGVAAPYGFSSATAIAATVPAGATSGPISLTTAQGPVSSAGSFTVTPTPTPAITGFTPTSGPPGTNVTITGTALTGTSAVRFGGVSAPYGAVQATSVVATVQAPATTGPISLTTPAGTATSAGVFTVLVPAAPTITSFGPTSGSPGSTVVLTGTDFTGAFVVRFNNTNAVTYTVNSATTITATVPPGSSTGPLRVLTNAGTGISTTNFVVVPLPSILGWAPGSGPVGTVVTVVGTSFTGTTDFRFNGVSALSFSVISSTQLTATVPPGATTGFLSLSGPGGSVSNLGNFTVTTPTAAANAHASEFSVWPNPVAGRGSLHISLATPAAAASATLRNVLGQTVATRAFGGSTAELPMTGLAAGTYLLTVQTDNRTPTTRRIAVE